MTATEKQTMELVDEIDALRKHVNGIRLLAQDIVTGAEESDAIDRASVILSLSDILEHDILAISKKIQSIGNEKETA